MSQPEHKGIPLAWRFVIWFVVIGLLPLAVSGYLSVRQNEEALRKEALGRMSRLADKKTLQIREYLAERIQHAELLARSTLGEQSLSDLSHAYARHGAGSAEYRRAVKPFEKSFAAYIGRGVVLRCVPDHATGRNRLHIQARAGFCDQPGQLSHARHPAGTGISRVAHDPGKQYFRFRALCAFQ